MTDNNKNIKEVENIKKSKFQINRVVVESYVNFNNNISVKNNENNEIISKNISNNLNNIDNNDDNNLTSLNINDNSNNKKVNEIKPIIEYSISNQSYFDLYSHIKKFDLPLIINNSSLSYLRSQNIIEKKENNKNKEIQRKFELPLVINNSSSLTYLRSQKITENKENNKNKNKEIKGNNENINNMENTEKKSFKKNLLITTSNLFICSGQIIKGNRIHLSGSTNKNEYDNVVHKEITNLKNSNNKSNEKVEINSNDNKKDNLLNSLEIMKQRWKESEKEIKFNFSYLNKNETIILNKKKYIDDLISKININSTSIEKDNQESYILIKQDRKNKNNKFIHEIVSPMSNKDLENKINEFILRNNDNKENNDDNIRILSNNKRTSQNIIIMTNEKKKSKFSTSNNNNSRISKKNSEEKNSTQKDDFSPVFIFSQKQIKNLLESIDKKNNQNNPKEKQNNSNNNSDSMKLDKQKNEELKNSKKEKLEEFNFNVFPVKVDKFEFIHANTNEFGGGANMNNNIDVSNIALNQSEYNYMKPIKGGENEYEISSRKTKESEDFSQVTPISLLQEKYYVYAVSKWAKYSKLSPQSQLIVKYNYKTGHPKFDPIHLDITNFTLSIEKIQTKNDFKRSLGNISSISNNLKSKSNIKINGIKNKTNKTGASIFLNESNSHYEKNNQFNKKKSKSNPKEDKKKNQ